MDALLPGFIPRAQHFFAKTYSEICKEARSSFAQQRLGSAHEEQERRTWLLCQDPAQDRDVRWAGPSVHRAVGPGLSPVGRGTWGTPTMEGRGTWGWLLWGVSHQEVEKDFGGKGPALFATVEAYWVWAREGIHVCDITVFAPVFSGGAHKAVGQQPAPTPPSITTSTPPLPPFCHHVPCAEGWLSLPPQTGTSSRAQQHQRLLSLLSLPPAVLTPQISSPGPS